MPIPPRVVEPEERAFVAVELFGPIDAAQREPRGAPGLVRRQAAAAILVLEQGEMRGELAGEVRSPAIGPEQRWASLEKNRLSAAVIPRSSRSSRLTSPAERRQRSTCSPSARVPDFVIA